MNSPKRWNPWLLYYSAKGPAEKTIAFFAEKSTVPLVGKKYEKVTKRLSEAVSWAGPSTGFSVTEYGMYLAGVKDVFWYGGAGGFWVIVWLVAHHALVDREKYGKMEYYQKLEKRKRKR